MRFTPLLSLVVLSSASILCLVSDACGQDVVFLRSGAEVEGRVGDLPGNRVQLVTQSGGRTLQKNEIERVVFDAKRRSGNVAETDIVVRTDLHEIHGKVKQLAGGEMVQVTLASGSKVVLPRNEVRKVIRKGELVREGSGFFTQHLAETIAQTMAKLQTAQGAEVAEVESFLTEQGIFAIESVRAALATAEAEGAPLATLKALQRVDFRYRLKETVANEIEDAEPRIYEILAPVKKMEAADAGSENGATREQKELLLFVFQRFTEMSVPVAVLLATEPTVDEVIRAWSVEFLRRMQRNYELVGIYRRSSGKTQLAAAVALGRNRILIGIPTLIETLELDFEEPRQFAVDRLREFTGENFRFRPRGAPAARKEAIAQWWGWWQKNESRVTETAEKLLRTNLAGGKERELAIKLWSQASASAREGQTRQAEMLLRRAMDVDPNFLPVQLNLAILLYADLRKPAEAVEILERFAERGFAGASYTDQGWAFLHLGHSKMLTRDYDGAKEAYRECLARYPDNVQALLGAAELELAQLSQAKLTTIERRDRLEVALQEFRRALHLMEKMSDEMVTLRPEDLPLVETLPFDRRGYNRSVFDVRKRYRQERFEALFEVAKIEARLGEREAAIRGLRGAVEEIALEKDGWKELETEMRTFLGLLYEGERQSTLALRQFQFVLRGLDPEQKECQRGIDRLRRGLSERASPGN